MSTCPEKELISAVYDNEVGDPWKSSIREHVSSCAPCRDIMQGYGKLHTLLKEDASRLELLSDIGLDGSFERLKARMSYKQVTSAPENVYIQVFARRVLPAIAAAAVFALILPVSFMKVSATQQNNTAALRFSPQPLLPKYMGVISDGTITHAELASMLGRNENADINLSLQKIDLYSLNSEKTVLFEDSPFQTNVFISPANAANIVNLGSQRMYLLPDVNR